MQGRAGTSGRKPPGIREHYGKWQVRYYGPDGQRHARSFDRKTDAVAFKRGVETDKQRGDWIDPRAGKVTVDEIATDWLGEKANVSPRTLINIEGRIRNYILPAFGHRRVSAVKPSHVRAWVADMSARGLAPSTVKATFRTFSQVMRTAVVDGRIRRSPCVGVDLPKAASEKMHFISPEQVAILAEMIDSRYRVLIYTAAYTGMRAGELAALKVERVNLLKRRAEVVESLSEVRGELVTGPTKTERRRAVSLPGFLADMIGEHIGRYPSKDGYVFSAPGGGPVRHHNFYVRHFRPAVEAVAELPGGLRFHDYADLRVMPTPA